MKAIVRIAKATTLFICLFLRETDTAQCVIQAVNETIVDSAMNEREAFAGISRDCPEAVRSRQALITVKYYSFDKNLHSGQLVIDKDLSDDIQSVFEVIRNQKFPVNSVIPVSQAKFRKNGTWDDDLSMEANNTSAFNYREITGGGRPSNHAYGRAIDINPVQNPYIKGKLVLPPKGKYDPNVGGTLTADHPVTREFIRLGWEWGGNWDSRKDYQHFEKPARK